ncbi:MAG: ABC transporter ATP-binding protein/permease [Acholeplasmatales bacterium]|jgi:ATP-binding cassette subfamily C protein|nr:ABC transporter ATP-binding protein/permease [Acholeplasmatales bacterium]
MKKRNSLKIMYLLYKLIGKLQFVMLLAILNGVISNLSSIFILVFGSVAVAKLLGENISLSYLYISLIIISLGVLKGFLRYIEQYCNHYIAFKLLAKIRDRMFKSLSNLSYSQHENMQKGDTISLITRDIETIEVFYAHTISPILIALIVGAVIFIFTYFVVSPILSFFLLFSYLLIGLILPIISNLFLRKGGIRYKNELSLFNSFFLDSIKGLNEIIFYNAIQNRVNFLSSYSIKLNEINNKENIKSNFISSLTQMVLSLLMVLGVSLLLYLRLEIGLSIGITVIGVVTVLSSFGPVIQLSMLPANLTNTFASGDRILDLLETKPDIKEIVLKNDITFENLKISNLSFDYNNIKILDNINIDISTGEIVGLIGKSGAGKTTLLKLIMRILESKNGTILYNGIDIEDINSKSLTNNIAYLGQQTFLFDDTILYNLLIANQNATEEEVVSACKEARIHDFIISLKDGYNTRVGSLGNKISAGEKQRIGLARAFLKKSKFLILDEPTSNVDSINEDIILNSISCNRKDKAILIVSHRESIGKITDRIYEIKKGELKIK